MGGKLPNLKTANISGYTVHAVLKAKLISFQAKWNNFSIMQSLSATVVLANYTLVTGVSVMGSSLSER